MYISHNLRYHICLYTYVCVCMCMWAYPGSSDGKELPAMQKNQVGSLDWKDPTEKGMAIHSSILAWRIPWTEEPRRLQSMGLQKVGHD